jgi:PEP-CTERM motif
LSVPLRCQPTTPADGPLLVALGEKIQFNEGPNPGSDALNMSLQRFPNGSGDFFLAPPTPDAVHVPEPSSITLLGFGALAGLVRRRRR